MRNEKLEIKNYSIGFRVTAKILTTHFCLFIVLFSLLIFSACQDPINLLSPQMPDGTGSVTLVIGGVNGRTILPDEGLSHFKAFTFDFYEPEKIDTDSPPVKTESRTNIYSSYTIKLPVGDYDLLVSAWADADKTKLAAQGRLEDGSNGGINIVEGTITTYTVTLKAFITGNETGLFKWEIKFPAGLTSASMTIEPADPSTGTTPDDPVEFTCDDTAAFTNTDSTSLNPGYYTVTFELAREDAHKITYREILHIYQNLESFFKYEFKDEHFSSTKYTVTFVYNDGQTQEALVKDCFNNEKINEEQPVYNKPIPAGLYQPTPPTDLECTFDGWYFMGNKWDFDTLVTVDMTLTAHWTAENLVDVSGEDGNNDVTKAINYVKDNPDVYTLLVGASNPAANTSVNIGSHTLPDNCNLTIEGMGTGERGLLGASAPLFTINEGSASLTLGKGVTLYGIPSTEPLVKVTNGSLIMEAGSKITGHTTSSPNGAVYVNAEVGANAKFTMKGGEITGNKSTSASANSTGGVYAGNGDFIMEGGIISGNTVSSSLSSYRTSDVFKENGGSLNLSGNARISYLTLTASDSANAVITIASDWSGSVRGLNLYAVIASITDTITYWKDRQVLQAAANHTLTAADAAKFTLGNFISSDGATQAINAPDTDNGALIGYIIADSGTDIGKLVANNETVAKIDNAEYQTLNAAIAAANETTGSPTEITIVRNITVPEPGMAANTGYILPDNKHIKLTVESGKTITITASAGSYRLFTVNSGTSLSLDGTGGSLTLKGNGTAASNRQGVYVNGGTFEMNSGVTITGFNNNGGPGGGVCVVNGTFTMKDGEISGNTAINGGGVYISGSTTQFIMQSGTIKNNNSTGTSSSYNGGGGVYVSGGTFTMNNGEISTNTATGSGSYSGGGGVYVYSSGTFTMSDGEISANTAVGSGSYSGGGGVYLYNGTFTMQGGEIKNNNSTSNGSSNYNGGGGIYVYYNGTFRMSGGTVYGADYDIDPSLTNTVSGSGTTSAAIYVYSSGTAGYEGDYASYVSSTTISTTNNTLPPLAVAQIDTKPYSTLNLAIAAAPDSGTDSNNPTVITILRDIVTSSSNYYTIPANKHIKLTVKAGENRVITASAGGFRPFTVNSGASLNLDGTGGSLTLNGNNENAASNRQGVYINGGTFTMNDGVTITGFKNSGSYGGGVYLYNSGTFNMNGGKISGNSSASNGGGVYVSSGTFNMNDGEISGNAATNTTGNGGGVYLSSGTFNMSGGKVSGNTSATGDIYVNSGTSVVYSISGDSVIGTITLYASSTSSNASITIGSDWSGSVTSLNLMGSNTTMTTVITYWYNATTPKTVLKAAAGYTLTSNDVAEFTLGNFITSNGSNTQSIGDDYYLNNSGQLVSKP